MSSNIIRNFVLHEKRTLPKYTTIETKKIKNSALKFRKFVNEIAKLSQEL